MKEIVQTVETSVPSSHGLPGHGWTLKKLTWWLGERFQRVVSKGTIHKLLHAADLSGKKCKKLLGKRDLEQRLAFLERFQKLYGEMVSGQVVVVDVDEAHFHRDLEIGYTRGRIGQRVWRLSHCPPLADRINWYGAYNFTDGACLIWNEGNCNKDHTVQFLHRLHEWIKADGRRLVLIWDGAPWHRAKLVSDAAVEPGIEVIPLPAYSPDRNPIEGLWKWMRKEVTQLCCYESLQALFAACKNFIDTINRDPPGIVNRLWPSFELESSVEKLQLSG